MGIGTELIKIIKREKQDVERRNILMDILSKILEILLSTYESSPFEVLFYLILLGSFLWLSKEFRAQQREDKELRKEMLEKSLSAYSQILYEGSISKPDDSSVSFYHSVYSALPFIDYKTSKKILLIFEQDTTEEDKVQEILAIAKSEFTFLSGLTSNHLLKNKLLTDDVEEFFSKLRKIFGSMFTSFFIIYSALLLVYISSSGETQFWMIAKPFSFFMACLLIPFSIDLLLERRMNIPTAVILIGIFISSFVLVGVSGFYLICSFVSFIGFLVAFLIYAYKRKKATEQA